MVLYIEGLFYFEIITNIYEAHAPNEHIYEHCESTSSHKLGCNSFWNVIRVDN